MLFLDHIPADLRDPFYTDQYEQEHIKPPIIHLLQSGDLYCRVCGLILPAEQAVALQNHQSVIRALSKKGIYVLETDNTPVSERDLSSNPIKMSSHIRLIDALMMAYTVEMMSKEKVLSSIKRFSHFSASKELPYDLEEAMVFWINKVNMKMREITEKESKMKQNLLDSPNHQKVRYRRDHLSGRTLQHFPLLDDLLKDVSDGTALLAVVHFYCPELIRLEDICLKEIPSIGDSVYNIQLLKEFSNEYLNKSFYLKAEDLLYCDPILKNNVMVFIAELFWWFETVKPDFVKPRDLHEVKDAVSKSPSHPLLPLRQRQQKGIDVSNSDVRNRSCSVTRASGQHHGSILAWPERRPRPLSQPVPYALHLTPEDNADSLSLARSISKDSLASSIMSITPKHMLGSGLPQHRLSGQSLLSHMRIEDEEKTIEEEELVAVIHPSELSCHQISSDMEQDELEVHNAVFTSPRPNTGHFALDRQAEGFHLEPLMPAITRPAKEKSINLNKQEESGESHCRSWRAGGNIPNTPDRKSFESNRGTCTPTHLTMKATECATSTCHSKGMNSQGFFLHLSEVSDPIVPFSSGPDHGQDSDSDIADLEEDEEEGDQIALTKEAVRKSTERFHQDGELMEYTEGEIESFKLREDLKAGVWDENEDYSGRSSPCLSTISWASNCSASGSASVKMTSFAEKKLLKLGLRDGFSSTSSSQKTTPDGSENPHCPPWQLRAESCSGWPGKDSDMTMSPSAVPSEIVQLHMRLEEQRRAIEYQKKKLETLSARQRLKLGKAAFLNIVKKGEGRSDTLPLPAKHSQGYKDLKSADCRDDSCLDALKSKEGRQMIVDNRMKTLSLESGAEPDRNDHCRSIDLLNEAISSIQQQMTQLSLKQDLLMKQNVASPTETQVQSDTKIHAVHFVDFGDSSSLPARRPPKLSSAQRSKTSERRQNKENSKMTSFKSKVPSLDCTSAAKEGTDGELVPEGSLQRNPTFRIHDISGKTQEQLAVLPSLSTDVNNEENKGVNSGTEVTRTDDHIRVKGQLIEVDLSLEDGGTDVPDCAGDEQKNVLGFFFKDDEKAEDEMAKRRAAFLLKQQRKAEEARLRKQQTEAESELKRDEARRKAEEDRVRKEEEKARRELIKQEYLQRKQDALMEEQGQVKPRPRTKLRRHRPNSLHREESKGCTTLTSWCVLTLVVVLNASCRAGSVCSMESFPVLSRTSSRNMERDWESGSIASSITSIEYNGPKLFKEPSSKSNKPIIINAIAHCCLAGKVNEVQKNVVLEV
uniref:Calmodulin-regulated spectrin-associated protein 1-B-like n=1 Tax=Gouania willdenowi TaxID=441366 RepID=A0A8C5DBA3_GOUWI